MKQIFLEKENNKNDGMLNVIQPLLKAEFGEKIFENWLSKINFYSFENGEIILSVSSKFLRDWIKREYLKKGGKNGYGLTGVFAAYGPEVEIVNIIYIAKEESFAEKEIQKKSSVVSSISKYDNLFPFGVELNKKYTFENFVAGDCNKLPFNVAKIFCENSQKDNFIYSQGNPLFFYGSVGLGKTHLAQAIAWHIKDNDKNNKILYLSAERFMYQFVKSLQKKDIMDFKNIFRSIDTLIIDDLQFIAGKNGTQEELLCTISGLIENNKKIILLCDKHPDNIPNIGKKLKSIISGGLVIDFKCPGYKTRLQILQHLNKIILPEKNIDQDVISLLADKIDSSVRALEGGMKKLVANYVLTGEEINLESAKNTLKDIMLSHDKKCDIEQIQKIVANHFAIKISDLSSKSRIKDVALPRQIAIYFSKKLTNQSLADIGLKFSKNHATVIHAVKKIGKLIDSEEKYETELRKIEDKINGSSKVKII